jgi:hypothetical protein
MCNYQCITNYSKMRSLRLSPFLAKQYNLFLLQFKNNKMLWYDGDHGLDLAVYQYDKNMMSDNRFEIPVGCYGVYHKKNMSCIYLPKLTTTLEYVRLKAYLDSQKNKTKNWITFLDKSAVDTNKLKKYLNTTDQNEFNIYHDNKPIEQTYEKIVF